MVFLIDDWKRTHMHTFIHRRAKDWNKEALYLSYQRLFVHVLACRWIIYVDTRACKHTHIHTNTHIRTKAQTQEQVTLFDCWWCWHGLLCCAFVLLVTQLCMRVCLSVCVCVLCLLLSLWRDVESPGAWWWMGVLSPVRSSSLCCLYAACSPIIPQVLHVWCVWHELKNLGQIWSCAIHVYEHHVNT